MDTSTTIAIPFFSMPRFSAFGTPFFFSCSFFPKRFRRDHSRHHHHHHPCPHHSRIHLSHAEKLQKYYRTALRLEVDFFAAQPFTPPPRPITLLVVDFDDTCTTEDTTSMILRAAIHSAAQSSPDPATAMQQGEEKLRWLVENYMNRRGTLLEEILPPHPIDTHSSTGGALTDEEAPDEFDMAWLGDFMDRLSDFDREMNAVVLSSGALAGLKRGRLSQVGSTITMRPGCLELLQRAVDAGVPTAIVSVNWSSELVAAALSQHGLPVITAGGAGGTRAGVEGAPIPPGALVIHSNDLEYFGDESTGGMKRRCECATDKGRIFEDLLLGLAAEGQAAEGGISVYIGDSMTDIPALISADVGVLMGTNRLVRQVAAVAGIPLRPLVAYPVGSSTSNYDGNAGGGGEPILYETSSWDEVTSFLFGPQFREPTPRTPTPREFSVLSSGLHAPLHPPRVLSIAGSDSGGGAGIQADIKTCTALGVFATTAVSSLTAQNTHGVSEIFTPPTQFLRSQIRAVLGDIGADAIKTGMLPSVEVVEAVADEITAIGCFPPLVVDPVLIATSGDALAEGGVARALASRLFPLATIVTPNIHEAEALLDDGGQGRKITDVDGMKAAAENLHALGPQWVVVKGGHLPLAGQVVDVLFDGKNFIEFKSPYLESANLHGTGCTMAATIAAELAKGSDVVSAVQAAKKYVWRALERSINLPLGFGPQKPMNHCFRVADWRADLERKAAIAAERGGASTTPTPAPLPRIPNPVDLRLYAITDADLLAQNGVDIGEAVAAAVAGGATIVQIREKKCDGGRFVEKAATALSRCRAAGIPLIVNDRVDVALAIGADGVHVGQEDLPVDVVRRLLGPDAIVGVSVKTVEEGRAAQTGGADYLGAGAVFPTPTKSSSVIGVEQLREVCFGVDIPVVAIGGVGKGAAQALCGDPGAGAAGIAVVSGIFGAKDVRRAAAELREEVDRAFSVD